MFDSNNYQEVNNMQKINIGLFGLFIIILLILYQNLKIMHYSSELQSLLIILTF